MGSGASKNKYAPAASGGDVAPSANADASKAAPAPAKPLLEQLKECSDSDLDKLFDALEIKQLDRIRTSSARAFKKHFHWCKVGKRMTFESSKAFAESMGGRLMTRDEAQTLLKEKGALLSGQDQWAAVTTDGDGRDWVQLGDQHHHAGKSHVHECGGYPGWGDNADEGGVWHHVALWVGGKDCAGPQVLDPATHFQKLRDEGSVYQCWWVEKHDGSRYAQHNYEDGYFTTYPAGSADVIDQGKWSMKDGKYFENNTEMGKLHGEAGNFYMDVDVPEHGYHKYVGTADKFDFGVNVTLREKLLPEVLANGHHCKTFKRMTFESSKAFAESMGGRLMTRDEAQTLLKEKGALLSGQDQWAAVTTDGDGRDWVQLGDQHHHAGKSHTCECGGYPGWGDNTDEGGLWQYAALWIGGKDYTGPEVLDQATHFQKLRGESAVYQVWLIEKHTGERFVQHNYEDGYFATFYNGSMDVIDQGKWSMKDGKYFENDTEMGELHGEAGNFYMDVDVPEHGYHKYVGTTDKCDGGKNLTQQEKIVSDAHYCKTTKSMSWESSKAFAEAQGGRLMTREEATLLLSAKGALLPGLDRWAAVTAGDERDWVQIGDLHHGPGTSHVCEYDHPEWGDNEDDGEEYHSSALWLGGIDYKEP